MTKLGYFVPNFPGQTHIFFHRELEALQREGIRPVLFSTLEPPQGVISHSWSQEAMSQTTYMGYPNPWDFFLGLWMLPKRKIITEIRQNGLSFVKDLLFCVSAARKLKVTCKSSGVEHVHVHSCARAALIACLCNLMGGATYSLTLHGPLSFFGSAQAFKWRHASFATVVTQRLLEDVKTELKGDLPEKVYVQPMGVDVDAFVRSKPYQPFQGEGDLRLFSCGRLNEGKGHQDVINVVASLRAKGVSVSLKIAGEDDNGGNGYRLTLQSLIDEHGLQNSVELLGAVDSSRVRAELEQAHIFVLASRNEALGVAYMEAMACQTPTIGSLTGGVPELIENEVDGVLVPPMSNDKLESAIVDLSKNPEKALRLSEAGRIKVMGGFTAKAGADTLIKGLGIIS